MKFKTVKKLSTILAISLALTIPGNVIADDDEDSMFNGTYHVSGATNCVYAKGDGFGDGFTLPNGGTTSSMTFKGEYIFNGDGTGHRLINWLNVSHTYIEPGDRPINYGTSESDFTYIDNHDGTFEMTKGITTVEKAFGAPQTNDGFGTSTWRFGVGRNLINKTGVNPTIQTITRQDGRVIERICNSIENGIKLSNNH